MAQLVMTAGQAALSGLQSLAPALANMAADAAVNALLVPDRDGPRLAELPVQTSTDGAPMARVWGRARIAGQVIWASRFAEHRSETGGGKGGPSQSEYSYSISFAVGLCEGEISGIGRVWANGALLDMSRYPVRLHSGAADQAPDALIQAVEGADAPGFRGTAYAVMEDWPLDAFGHRIPNLSFEVFRRTASGGLERQVHGVNLIPGSGEFAYAVEPVMRELGPGRDRAENVNNSRGLPDLVAAIDDLERDLPECRSVQLVVAWFGNDLRCGTCEIRPGVETRDKLTHPALWSVAGADRTAAWLVSEDKGRPVYGGTPDDTSVIAAIRHLKERGFSVSLYPFILMDIPAGNGLPDPHGGSEQAVFPWRGRITCHPAPGQPGTVDESAGAEVQVDAFFGTAAASDFTVSGGSVTYAGPAEWGLRRFILHCAALARAAGGVDGFLIGSEMVGLTTVRGAGGTYPAVDALCDLAVQARALLGPAATLSYAADWTEYSGHQPGGGAKLFHLDPLWSHPAIDAVAVDWYVPLSDWRSGTEHLDAGSAPGPRDRAYFAGQVAGGEGYDWYYASQADRDAQVRTPITDGAHDEAWIWRFKDLKNWWSNAHHDRPGGVRSATPTGWVPMSKPIWLTEVGCPAVDKGANRPNVFVDPKSSESHLPWYSNGARDDLVQRRYLEALLAHWDLPAFNPVSPLYGGPMIDPAAIHVWAWDARPWPDFPARETVWADGANWRLGHWLNGRAGQVPVAEIVADLAGEGGLVEIETDGLDDLVSGYLVDRPMSARAALEPLAAVLGMDVLPRADRVEFRSAGSPEAVIHLPDAALTGETAPGRRDPAPAELPRDVRLSFYDDTSGYRPGHAAALETFGTVSTLALSAPVVAGPDLARRWCAAALADAGLTAPVLETGLPPSALAAEPGDGLLVEGVTWSLRARSGAAAGPCHARPPARREAAVSGGIAGVGGDGPAAPSRPVFAMLDLPVIDDAERDGPLIAAAAEPWPGGVDIHAGGERRLRIGRPALFGVVAGDLAAGPRGYWDRAATLEIELDRGSLSSATPMAVLNGANRLAVEQGGGDWEILAFAEAELVAPGRYRLHTLLRGLFGSRAGDVTAGARIVRLDGAPQTYPLASREIGEDVELTAVPAGLPATHSRARTRVAVPRQRDLTPLAPVHVTVQAQADGIVLGWTRCTRVGGDDWHAPDVPLGEAQERYRVRLMAGETVMYETETAQSALALSTDDLTAIFGDVPDTLDAAIAQISARVGAGREARHVLAL
ncbi:glycoside hydrolase/phage tail family protein [Maricaulis sp.]|uniref:baseplate multidomain protein megatron n=1 Tax=Maricaulis sp. TaxID=1486257 RepID=UPI0026150EC0|nr:glycoside hydrolase/phage tail family protein [Maricaulis sp.]